MRRIAAEAAASPIDNFGELLRFEAIVIEKAFEALKDIQRFLAVAGTSPTKAVKRLAEFSGDIVEAFGSLVGNSRYADLKHFGSLAEMVYAEASQSLGGGIGFQPKALLVVNILKARQNRTFDLATYVGGEEPKAEDIAVAQRVANLG